MLVFEKVVEIIFWTSQKAAFLLANQILRFSQINCVNQSEKAQSCFFQVGEVENGNEGQDCGQKMEITNNFEKHLWKKHKKVTFARCIDTFFAIVDQLSNSFLLTTLSTPKVCRNLILESNESFCTSTNKTILVFRLFCQPS